MNSNNKMMMFFRRLKAIKKLMKDPEISVWKKALVILGIVYLLSPIDLIPLPVLGFGILDDLALWVFIISYLSEHLDKYDMESGKIYHFGEKKTVKNVKYTVKPDEKAKIDPLSKKDDQDKDDKNNDEV